MSRILVAGDQMEPPRTVPGERLEHLFEQASDRWPDAVAVDLGDAQLTYAEIDGWTNRMARLLRDHGIRAGDRVGLLFEQPLGGHVAMLAALKIGASFVPMDVGFPADRIEYILSDAGAAALLTTDPALREVDGLRERAAEKGVTVLSCEDLEDVRTRDPDRLRDDERGGGAADDLAYVIYTSGSTGRPKGVGIGHPAICNFVRVAADEYGVRSDDRMYQGLTLAFDFSVEEIWTTWLNGATLVPKPAGVTLVGPDLQDFLVERRITAMCCVPTLLATLEPDLPELRFLLVSGEACPQSLVERWYRDDRRFLNVYGPTEATVTATWTSLHPDRPVTIGGPLPTYAIVILDPEDPQRALPHGETGEIGIAGIGLARGYLNREEKTAESFVPDFLDLPHNPPGKIYRTGDLGRVNDDGEIEYHGRIDLQVKIRGYRIEIGEIESVLLGAPGVTQAVVDTYSPADGVTELVGYYSGRAPDRDAIRARLRDQLPPYMVPSYLEQLESIPMTTQDKADRRNLPAPTGGRASSTSEHVGPANDLERALAAALGAALGLDEVSVTADFFDELGATSLSMAGFTAAVRQDPDLPTVSARDIYRHTTIRELAGNLGPAPSGNAQASQEPLPRTSSVTHALTGGAQAVLVLLTAFAAALAVTESYAWVSAAVGWVDVGARAVAAVAAIAVALSLLPVVVKWVVLGRARASTVPLWGVRYLRFWVVRSLVRISPLRLLPGTPLYTLYLRMLGVRVGRGAVVFTREVPAAPDLVRIGERAVIHPEVVLGGYRAVPGALELGPVEIGADAVVGQASVLDVHTGVGDGAQLGHSSALHPGGSVPAGEVWHGSPAEAAGPDTDYRTVEPVGSGPLRRAVWSGAVAVAALVGAGAVFGAVVALYGLLASRVPALFGTTAQDLASSWQFYLAGLATVIVGYVALVTFGLAAVIVVPRLLRRIVTPGRTYPLYGVHDVAQRLITALSNSPFLVLLLGDSSFVTAYVRGLGYDLGRMEQTGSNFGTQLRQDSPSLTTVGGGTMISDGLRVMNVDYSHDSFVARPVTIGERNFVGNDVHVPAGARTGDNVLLATKVMVPVNGPVREDTGLLGSPPFEIPRSSTDRESGAPDSPRTLAAALRRKNRYNAGTVVTVLALRGVGIALGLAPSAASIALWPTFGVLALGPAVLLGLVLLVGWSALLERAVLGFRGLRPRSCSIYDRYFWFHERLWKFYVRPILPGTPFAVWSNRLAGLTVGRRVFDDGCSFPEKSLVEIGDDAVLNTGSVVQCHSLEDGRFESDRVHVGDGVTLGTRAFVHYGVSLGDGARLAADSFLLKGEQVGTRERWAGNPAEPVREPEPTDLQLRDTILGPPATGTSSGRPWIFSPATR